MTVVAEVSSDDGTDGALGGQTAAVAQTAAATREVSIKKR